MSNSVLIYVYGVLIILWIWHFADEKIPPIAPYQIEICSQLLKPSIAYKGLWAYYGSIKTWVKSPSAG